MDVKSPFEQLFFVTILIRSSRGAEGWIATGFLFNVQTELGEWTFIVTNRHVFENADSVSFRFIQQQGGVPDLGRDVNVRVTNWSERMWASHPNPAVDVAVMPLLGLQIQMSGQGQIPFFRSIPHSVSLTPRVARELDAIEEILFLGYPSGIFDARNLTPVARRGITATPLALDYEGTPSFLVDAAVFPGSSGSPVFIADRGMYHRKSSNSNVIGSRLILLGVLAAVHVRQVQGEVTNLPARIVVELDDPLNLGIVFKAWTIQETITVFMDRHISFLRKLDLEDVDPSAEVVSDAFGLVFEAESGSPSDQATS